MKKENPAQRLRHELRRRINAGLWTHPRDRTADYNRLLVSGSIWRGRWSAGGSMVFSADVLRRLRRVRRQPGRGIAERHANPGETIR